MDGSRFVRQFFHTISYNAPHFSLSSIWILLLLHSATKQVINITNKQKITKNCYFKIYSRISWKAYHPANISIFNFLSLKNFLNWRFSDQFSKVAAANGSKSFFLSRGENACLNNFFTDFGDFEESMCFDLKWNCSDGFKGVNLSIKEQIGFS